MKIRRISAATFLAIYLAYLAWYDGWGIDPLTAEDVEALVDRASAYGADTRQLHNLRRMAEDDDGEEFFMLNLNRYEYAEGEVKRGVPEAYQKYGQAVIQMILKNAGHPVYSGEVPDYLLAGELENGSWHEIIVVRYRSRRDFVSMVTSDEYLKIARHRAGGIRYAEVTPTRATINLVTPRLAVLTLLALLAWLIDRQIRRAR
ncbi:MAG: DUF1330 domain-containing protein [Pseudomonadales bacterium]|jgi:uncharacterized protein (DUF1330 family)|nr:DUF1330 domain-containing protein [Pseudomonadales bacterium]MDP6469980.1 DUF1330 domain-containing protein [Pseudomonadales bacterium]MDP6829148.1 DUF1330 domain-containing protein [Pseudomonadales bacterium]|tara:strand:- start:286 stop:894 length:609 start_codon:yes stop_codon:yes gene_type:complete